MSTERSLSCRALRSAISLLSAGLLGLCAFLPQPVFAQEGPTVTTRQWTAAERERACAVADAAWPVLAAAFKPDHRPEVIFVSVKPYRFRNGEPTAGGASEWKEYQSAWKFIWRREIPDSRPPSPALYQRWRQTTGSSIFECDKLAEAHAVRTVTSVPRSSGLGVRLDDIYVRMALPIVSADGLSALVYATVEDGTGYGSTLTHLAKIKGEWRIVGQRSGEFVMV